MKKGHQLKIAGRISGHNYLIKNLVQVQNFNIALKEAV